MPYFEDVSSASEKHVKQLAEASQMSGQAPYLLDQWSTVKSQNLPDKTLSDTLPVFSIEDKKMKAEEQAIAAKKLAMSDSSREAIDGGTKDSKDANFPQKRLVDGESMNDRAQHWHDSQEKQNEHNKLVFAEIDSDHNGRLNLSEVENAINNPAADFTNQIGQCYKPLPTR